MPDFILDGGGRGFLAQVNTSGELATRAVVETEELNANEKGKAYNINTKNITLTDDADTPVIYFKNTGEDEFFIVAVAIGLTTSTGGTSTEPVEITFIRQPKTGTIIDNAIPVAINSNRNYGSSNSLSSLAYKGATGDTMTDGDDHIFVYGKTDSRSLITINEILPKGTSFGLKIKPQSGNTSMTCYAAIIGFSHGDD